MRHREFNKITKRLLADLTVSQTKKLIEALQTRGDKVQEIIDQKQIDDLKCPQCKTKHVHRHGRAHGLQRYKCQECRRTFNALTGTPLSRLRKKDCWLKYHDALNNSYSVRKSAALSGVHKNTSFRWRHRFLKTQNISRDQSLSGIVEIDECFILESCKGKRGLSRKARKRGGKSGKRGLSSEQIPILIARDRSGNHIDAVLPDRSEEAISTILKDVVSEKDALLCVDGDKAVIAFAEKHRLEYELIIASQGEHVHEKVLHIQNVNSYMSRLKTWLKKFNGVATKYLQTYLGWRRMLDLSADTLTPETSLTAAMG
jgi:transposase-like protein